ncbi:Rrf2 family protein [Sphingomonas sp. SORGH_AS802]|jgi:Rrf2 family protein|uniref:RrF2 family transcriptional regulator n=1 Tax=unclassified Sphingomonas TaxID=196159 RepID=UPI000F7D68EE|nr:MULTISPECIES: Rrf2 family transcriptional regulator [unclassified Sphingomonas]MDR6125636.1 Rrf2 family protein [Sphingomonas sp. SORGH_AS_0438]MDR6134250.1 Rrf2 family protein [Sphingomonas sp. SORGH_AS_0802]RSU46870.1 Rrf2 family transcriptional regulator [Sphingomonas sp. S-NIH.Pt15_0812]
MLTQRSRYALRSLLFLATAPVGSAPIPMTRIAAEANVPRKFLELILADLREAGLVLSHRGKHGGYLLARPAHLISLGDIIRTIEGPLALVPCVSRTAYRRCTDCKDEAACAIRQAMARVRDETARILDGTSLADATAEQLVAA